MTPGLIATRRFDHIHGYDHQKLQVIFVLRDSLLDGYALGQRTLLVVHQSWDEKLAGFGKEEIFKAIGSRFVWLFAEAIEGIGRLRQCLKSST